VRAALGNSGDPALLDSAERLVTDPAPVVADAARWALERLTSGN
jgi:epoxyqueuosine reductase